MARTLRYVGTNSGNNGCPTLYKVETTGDYVVQGARPEPDDLAQLRHLAVDEAAVIVPRALLANFGPKEAIPTREHISFDDFDGMFTTFQHTAWRLETRRRYASDEAMDTYQQFLREGRVDWDLDDPWCVERREQTALGKRIARVRSSTRRPRPASCTCSTTPAGTPPAASASTSCRAPAPSSWRCPRRTSGSSTPASSRSWPSTRRTS
jgi:hypothetical protein